MSLYDKLREKAAAQKITKEEQKVDDMMEGAEEENKKVASILSRLKGNKEENKTLQEKANAVVEEVVKNSKMAETDTVNGETEEKNDLKTKTKEEKDTRDNPTEEKTAEDDSTEEESHEEVDEKETEEKPKKRGRRKKAEETSKDDKEKEKPSDIRAAKYEQNYDILGQKVNYDEMMEIILDFFGEDDWQETEETLHKKLSEIRIEPDMNPGTLKYALAALNGLYDEVAILYDNQQKILTALADKNIGAAVAYKNIHSVGNNAEERERNGLLALTQAKIGEKTVNYIAIIAAARVRNVFLNNFIDRIKYKSNICITMSGAIKMEQSLITMSS